MSDQVSEVNMAVIHRIARAQGHLESVRKMIERGENPSDILIQLSAVVSALNASGRVILKDHIEHCVVDAIENNDDDSINKLYEAIDRFMR